MLKDLIQKCELELAMKHTGYVRRFEESLSHIAALKDPACIPYILPLFEDDTEYDVAMFSMIHLMEMFDEVTYVRAIVDNLDSFFLKSQEWANVVLMRILNSPTALNTLTNYIQTRSHEENEVIRKMLASLKCQPMFASRCESLLGLIS